MKRTTAIACMIIGALAPSVAFAIPSNDQAYVMARLAEMRSEMQRVNYCVDTFDKQCVTSLESQRAALLRSYNALPNGVKKTQVLALWQAMNSAVIDLRQQYSGAAQSEVNRRAPVLRGYNVAIGAIAQSKWRDARIGVDDFFDALPAFNAQRAIVVQKTSVAIQAQQAVERRLSQP